MGASETLVALVDDAFAAAFDDALWEPWSARLVEALGASGGAFHVLDRNFQPTRATIHNAKPSAIDDYFDSGVYRLDPQIVFASRLGGSCIFEESDHLDYADPATAEYMSWMAGSVGWTHHLTCIAALGGGCTHVAISAHRHAARGATPAAERRRLTAIFPQITRALELGFVHAGKLRDAFWDGLAESHAEPTLLIGETGRVLRTNAALDALLGTGDGLDVTSERLRATLPVDDARLAALIARATAPAAPRAGAARITRRSGRAAYIVTAFPLPRSTRMLAPAEGAALVTVIDPSGTLCDRADVWREAFDLTRRESELAALLIAGHSLTSAATVLAIAEPTARIHLRHLFDKTRTSRQAEFVRLLVRLG